MPFFNRNLLLEQALADYNPALVKVDDFFISSIGRPALGDSTQHTLELPGKINMSPRKSGIFLMLMTALNYMFWERLPDGQLRRYQWQDKTGSKALWDAFSAAWGKDSLASDQLVNRILTGGFERWFGQMPDLPSRVSIFMEMVQDIQKLEEVGEELFWTITSSHAVTVADAYFLAQQYPLAFGDPYLKKAQLALSLYARHLRLHGFGVSDANLTAFADYQVPRVLRALAILQYSHEIGNMVDGAIPLLKGSAEEKALRAATILACKEIADCLKATEADVDNFIWQAQAVAGSSKFHLTHTTYY